MRQNISRQSRQSKPGSQRKYRSKPPVPRKILPQYLPTENRFVLPPRYWEEEGEFIQACLQGRLSRQSEKQWADYYEAMGIFYQKGVTALPIFLRRGGWADVFPPRLLIELERICPVACSIAQMLVDLRYRVQGPKDSGRDEAAKLLQRAASFLVPEKIKISNRTGIAITQPAILRSHDAALLLYFQQVRMGPSAFCDA